MDLGDVGVHHCEHLRKVLVAEEDVVGAGFDDHLGHERRLSAEGNHECRDVGADQPPSGQEAYAMANGGPRQEQQADADLF